MTTVSRRIALAAPFILAAQGAVAQRPGRMPAEIIHATGVEQFDMAPGSGTNGEPWRIFLAVPQQPPEGAGYPVIYLLDGNATFPLAWHALEERRRKKHVEPVALVGLGYPTEDRFDVRRRFHDLTPPTAREYLEGRSEPPRTGGQDQLRDFLCGPLRTAVAQRLPIDLARQALFGHSLGGLFVLHQLYTRPECFGTYLAADPSIWWNGRSILQEQSAFLAGIRAAGGRLATPIRLLVQNSGRNRPAPPDASPTMLSRANGPGGAETAQALSRIPGLEVGHTRFDDESHGSMLLPAIAEAIGFFLDRR